MPLVMEVFVCLTSGVGCPSGQISAIRPDVERYIRPVGDYRSVRAREGQKFSASCVVLFKKASSRWLRSHPLSVVPINPGKRRLGTLCLADISRLLVATPRPPSRARTSPSSFSACFLPQLARQPLESAEIVDAIRGCG